MNDIKISNKRYEQIAWGILLLLLGILILIPGNQEAIFVLGIGIILLGLNIARRVSKIPISGFSITVGILAIVVSTAALLRPLLNLPGFELPFFPVLLIIIGLYLLIPRPKRTGSE